MKRSANLSNAAQRLRRLKSGAEKSHYRWSRARRQSDGACARNSARTGIRTGSRSGKLNRLERKWIAAVLQHICEINDGIGGAFVTAGGGMSVCRQAEEAESRRRRRRRRGLEGVRDSGVSRAKRVVNRMRRERERGEGLAEGRRPVGWWGGWEGSDVLPVSIIIGGWLTGRRFAPHNSRRPIILPRLPCTNSYITCSLVLPSLYIITCGAILSRTFFQTIADCGGPRFRGFKIVHVPIITRPAPYLLLHPVYIICLKFSLPLLAIFSYVTINYPLCKNYYRFLSISLYYIVRRIDDSQRNWKTTKKKCLKIRIID